MRGFVVLLQCSCSKNLIGVGSARAGGQGQGDLMIQFGSSRTLVDIIKRINIIETAWVRHCNKLNYTYISRAWACSSEEPWPATFPLRKAAVSGC